MSGDLYSASYNKALRILKKLSDGEIDEHTGMRELGQLPEAVVHDVHSMLKHEFGGREREMRKGVVYIDPIDDPDNPHDADHIMVCEVCDQGLDAFTLGGELTWIHSRAWERYDHEPVVKAVPRDTKHKQICDYCGTADEPLMWAFVGDRMRVDQGPHIRDYGTTWGACGPCSQLIRDGDLEGLMDRVNKKSKVANTPDKARNVAIRQSLLNQWTMFFPTVKDILYVGPKREPSKLNPRLMPKLQMGLLKFWKHPDFLDRMNRVRRDKGLVHSLPGVHCGVEERFTVQFPPDLPMPEQAWRNHVNHLCAGIEGSELFWISENFTQLAIMAGKDFDKLIISREELPSKFGFMIYASPIGVLNRTHGAAAIRGLSWTLVPDGIWVNLYFQGEDADPEVAVEEMRADSGWLMSPNPGGGITFDDEMQNLPGDEFDFIRTIFATWFLMTQPGVAERQNAPVDKKLARSYQRAHGHKLPDVQLVDLRQQPHRTASDTPNRVGRPLKERIYRRGHWKRQPYGPKRGMRKTIYVSAYIAGPTDAPLKAPKPVVKVLR